MLSSSPSSVMSTSPSRRGLFGQASLTWVQGTVELLKDTMDIVGVVPYVSAVAAVTIKILEVLDSVRSNKEACERLARYVGQISTAIAKRSNGPEGPEFAEDLQDDLAQFEQTLEKVFSFVVEQTQTHYGPRAIFHKQIKERVKQLEKELNSAQDLFIFESVLSIRAIRSESGEAFSPVSEPRKVVRASFRLPPAPTVFFGRERMIQELSSAILAGRWIPIIGAGGVGKTSLALSLLHHPDVVERFGENRYFVVCEEARDCGALVRTIAARLGLSGPFAADYLRELVRSSLGEHSPTLLCLDCLESSVADKVSEVEAFLEDLEGIEGLTLMVTMRTYVLPAPRIRTWLEPFPRLESLDPDSALQTFVAVAGKGTGDDKVLLLLKQLHYFPLAVTLMAVLARQGADPSELYDQWRNKATGAVTRGEDNRLQSLDASIRLSIDSLPVRRCPDAIRLLSVVCLLPKGVFKGKLPHMVPEGFDHVRVVAVLQQVGLAERSTAEEVVYDLHLHAIIREFMKAYHRPDDEILMAVHKFYLKMADGGNWRGGAFAAALEAVRPEMRNMQAVFDYVLKSRPPTNATSVAEAEGLRRCLTGLDFFQRTLSLDTSLTQQALQQLSKPPRRRRMGQSDKV